MSTSGSTCCPDGGRGTGGKTKTNTRKGGKQQTRRLDWYWEGRRGTRAVKGGRERGKTVEGEKRETVNRNPVI